MRLRTWLNGENALSCNLGQDGVVIPFGVLHDVDKDLARCLGVCTGLVVAHFVHDEQEVDLKTLCVSGYLTPGRNRLTKSQHVLNSSYPE